MSDDDARKFPPYYNPPPAEPAKPEPVKLRLNVTTKKVGGGTLKLKVTNVTRPAVRFVVEDGELRHVEELTRDD
jgi:hypothetical protein